MPVHWNIVIFYICFYKSLSITVSEPSGMMYVQAGCPMKDNGIYSAIAVTTNYTNHN